MPLPHLILLAVLALCMLVSWYFYLVVYTKLAFYKSNISKATTAKPPVSIIICARNEAQNLQKFLPQILEQDYPSFEVVLVNDCSLDDTEDTLKILTAQYPHLSVVTIENNDKYQHGKKFALTLGIKAAKYEWLLLTDADCQPASNQWISTFATHFTDDKDIVLGFSPYFHNGGMLSTFIQYDTFLTALNYISFALARMPYMGVGRNMAYRKELFFKVKGFAQHMHIKPGDDDLFINQTATATNTAVNISPESFMFSIPKETFKEWIDQKIRHLSVGKFYKSKFKNIFAIQYITRLLLYISIVALFVLNFDNLSLLALFLLWFFVKSIIVYLTASKFKFGTVKFSFLLIDFVYFIFQPLVSLISYRTKNIQWK